MEHRPDTSGDNGMNIQQTNKILANALGIETVEAYASDNPYSFDYKGITYYYEWTINDARCREFVREHFFIETEYDFLGTWVCACKTNNIKHKNEYSAESTIKKAEITIMVAIGYRLSKRV